ncbi:MAG: endonuclease III [Candidatus Gracilibacteria bacterium]|nr:endonuclease III [Candidatus Gracilibacteria bacterium]
MPNRSAIDPTVFQKALDEHYPDEPCHLHWDEKKPWTLLFAVMLSAQCTDARVNKTTPELFEKFPDLESFVARPVEELEAVIRPTGFFRSKAKHLRGAAETMLQEHNGKLPDTLETLVKLPGVGRKTANVILWTAFGKNEGFVVDTHVLKITNRAGLIKNDRNPERVEQKLMQIFPQEKWGTLSHQMVQFGRDHCTAPTPKCSGCFLQNVCPKIGVKRWK